MDTLASLIDSVCTADDLPDEILQVIFAHCAENQCYALDGVCKRWQRLFNPAVRYVRYAGAYKRDTSGLLMGLLRFANLQHLCVNDSMAFSDAVFAALVSSLKCLRSVSLSPCLVKNFSVLDELPFFSALHLDDPLFAIAVPTLPSRLEQLSIISRAKVQDKIRLDQLRHLTALRAFKYRGTLPSDQWTPSVPDNVAATLETVELGDMHLSAGHLQALSRCVHLKTLQLSNVHINHHYDLDQILPQLSELRRLVVARMPSFDDEHLRLVAKHCPKLVDVVVGAGTGTTRNGLRLFCAPAQREDDDMDMDTSDVD